MAFGLWYEKRLSYSVSFSRGPAKKYLQSILEAFTVLMPLRAQLRQDIVLRAASLRNIRTLQQRHILF